MKDTPLIDFVGLILRRNHSNHIIFELSPLAIKSKLNEVSSLLGPLSEGLCWLSSLNLVAVDRGHHPILLSQWLSRN